jgi:putative ABC transport system permease protein
VVQRDTLDPYAKPSSVRDDAYRSLLAIPGVVAPGNVTHLTMQVRHERADVRVMLVGFEPGLPGEPGCLVAGRPITRSHYEAIADVRTGFALGRAQPHPPARLHSGRSHAPDGVVGRRSDAFAPLADAQEAQFVKDNDALVNERALTVIRILDEMAQRIATAIIVVTHDEKIIPTFRRIYRIRDGRTCEEAGEGRVP